MVKVVNILVQNSPNLATSWLVYGATSFLKEICLLYWDVWLLSLWQGLPCFSLALFSAACCLPRRLVSKPGDEVYSVNHCGGLEWPGCIWILPAHLNFVPRLPPNTPPIVLVAGMWLHTCMPSMLCCIHRGSQIYFHLQWLCEWMHKCSSACLVCGGCVCVCVNVCSSQAPLSVFFFHS